jgi:hypothetical protein
MNKIIFNITKMDCPSEEQLIPMKLQNFDAVKSLEFIIMETLNLYTILLSTKTRFRLFL